MAETIGYNKNSLLSKRMSKKTEKRYRSALDRLELGQSYRQKQREAAWEDSYDMYMGDEWNRDPNDPTADVVNINVAFSTINTLVPFVSDEDPQFMIKPYSGDATPENAAMLESFINRLWKSSDMRGQIHLSDGTYDYLLLGDGFLKVGYEIKMKDIYDSLGEKVQNQVRIGKFFVSRVNPWDIWIDPYSDGVHNARWVAQRMILPVSELISDERYKIKNVDDVEGGGIDTTNIAPEDRSRLDDVVTEDWVTVYEFYDITENWMMSFTVGGATPLRYIEGIKCPIIQIPNYRIPNSPYHMGELEQIKSLQIELNKTRSQMITHRRRNAGKWAVRLDLLSDEAKQAMQSGITNDIIPIEANEPIEHIITYIAPAPLSADSYNIEASIRQDINEITGVNEYLRGVPQGISRTATEATILEGATNIRTRHKLLQIERAARETGQLLLDIIRDVLPLTTFEEMRMYITGREAERLNRITGAEELNTDQIFTPTPEIFQGRYEVEVERGSTELRNPQIQAQKYAQIVQLMLGAFPTLMQMQITFNMKRLLELWLEAEGIEDVDALFESDEQQDMLQQMMMMQQAQAAMGQSSSASGQPSAGGAGQTQPGQPRPQTTNAPEEMINPSNSGMMPATY